MNKKNYIKVAKDAANIQLKELKKNENNRYLKLFKLNNFSGLLLFIGIFSINL